MSCCSNNGDDYRPQNETYVPSQCQQGGLKRGSWTPYGSNLAVPLRKPTRQVQKDYHRQFNQDIKEKYTGSCSNSGNNPPLALVWSTFNNVTPRYLGAVLKDVPSRFRQIPGQGPKGCNQYYSDK